MLKELNPGHNLILSCVLIKTMKRLTFHIVHQDPAVTNYDDNGIISFTASNGYDIISEHRMDIQSRRIWLWGAAIDEPARRSGTMAVPTQKMTEEIFPEYKQALLEWAKHNNGSVLLDIYEFTEEGL